MSFASIASAGAVAVLAVTAFAGPAAATAGNPACTLLAAALRAAPDRANPAGGISLAIDDPLRILETQPAPILEIDRSGALTDLPGADRSSVIAELAAAAPPDLAAAIRALDPNDLAAIWERRAGPLGAIEVEDGGTLRCTRHVFFATAADGGRSLVPAPPAYASGGEVVGYCYVDRGHVGIVGGTPVFIGRSWAVTEPVYELAISGWTGAGWTPACGMTVTYEAVFTVAESHCATGDCAALAALAPDLAARANDPALATLAPQLDARTAGGVYDDLPAPDGIAIDSPYRTFADEAAIFRFTLGGTEYLAKAAAATIGWRISPTRLLAVYELRSATPVAVASFVLTQGQGPLADIVITEP